MKKFICFLACVCLSVTTFAVTYSVSNNGDGTCCLTGVEGELKGDIVLPSEVNGLKVTSIGWRAFEGCSGLTSVTIPDSVTSIGWRAFYKCSNLTSVTIPNGVTEIGWSTFEDCSSLTSVTIPDSVTNIEYSAFRNCSSLTSIIIPKSVKSIGDYAFKGCAKLADTEGFVIINGILVDYSGDATNVKVPESVTSIGGGAFSQCSSLTSVTIPAGFTGIEDYAFYWCQNLTEVTIPNSVTSIGSYAFCGCRNLEKIKMPESVTRIGGHAFEGCTKLSDAEGFIIVNGMLVDYSGNETSVKIPESVTSIGGRVFYRSQNLAEVTIPNGVTSIGEWAFYGCSGLTSIIIPNSVTSIGEWAFYGCSGLTSIIIPNSVTSIGYRAFANCSSLTSATIPNNETNIGWSAFEGCSELRTVKIPESAISSSNYIFSGCENITSIELSEGVTSIGARAFAGFSSLLSIKIPNSVTRIDSTAFQGCSNLREVELPTALMVRKVIRREILCEMQLKEQFPDSFDKLERVILSDGVKVLPNGFFDGCDALKEVSFPSTLEDFGNNDVRILGERIGKSELWIENGWVLGYIGEAPSEVKVPEDVIGITSCAFEGQATLESIILPASLRTIRAQAFAHCTSLTELNLPEGVTQISAGAFQDCSLLQELSLPKSLTYLGNASFANCTALSRLYCQDGLVEIGNAAFSNCWGMLSVALPTTLKKIGSNVFWGCNNITNVTIPTFALGEISKTSLVSVEIAGDRIDNEMFYNCSSLTSVIISDGVTSIDNNAFYGCSHLVSIVIPASVTSIGDNTFYGCINLREVELSSAVMVQEKCLKERFPNSFGKLESVILGEGVKVMPNGFFDGCEALKTVSFPSTLEDFGNNDVRVLGERIGKSELWIENGWVLGYIGEAPSEVKVSEGVIGIASYAFEGQTVLESIVLPSSLRTIGAHAFTRCTSLAKLDLPVGVTQIDDGAFQDCTWLQELSLSKSLTHLGNASFANCTSLPHLYCPEGLVEIGDAAFSNCWRMSAVSIPTTLEKIGRDAFWCCGSLTSVTIPSSVTYIGYGAFAECSNIQEISLPGNVARVADVFPAAYNAALVSAIVTGTSGDLIEGLFQDCFSLKFVTIPTCVTNIGAYAFSGCSQLEPFALWDGIVSIGNNAFYGVKTGQSLAIPDSVTSIGENAFGNCFDIRSVTMPVGLCALRTVFSCASDRITSVTFTGLGTEIPDKFLYNCSAVSSVTIPKGVTKIGAYAFSGTSLAFIEIPSTVTNIGACAFAWLSSLKELALPVALQKIGDGAFAGLTLLEELTLPAALQEIGDYAFAGCSRLTSLSIPKGVTTLGANVFDGCKKLESVYYFTEMAPSVKDSTYQGSPSTLASYVLKGSTAWDGIATSKALPQVWPSSNGRAIEWWEPNIFEVTFVGNGGAPESQTVAETTWSSYVLPSEPLEREGYSFAGWRTEPINGGEVKASTKVKLTQPHTLYAHWRQNTYTIKFDLNGVTGEVMPLEMTYGETKALPLCKVPRLDYSFAGWSWTPEGTVDFADGASVCNLTAEDAGELTLYAVWEPHAWSIADYLNTDNLAFTVEGDAEWMPDVTTNHDGTASMRSGVIGKNQKSTLKTSVKGKGTLSFWWKVICEPADSESGKLYDYLELTVDGKCPESVQPIAGDVGWTQVTVRIDGEATEHEIAWSFVKDGYDAEELADVAWVDEVVWTPDPVTLSFSADDATEGDVPSPIISAFAETVVLPGEGSLSRDGYAFVGWSDGASTYESGSVYEVGLDDVAFVAVWRELSISDILNAPDFIFTTGGDAKWAIDTTTTYDGVVSLRSGAIEPKQESWVETSVLGAGALSFWWKADGLVYRDNPANYVQITVDGTVVSNVAVTGWAYVLVNISEDGEHTVRWTYKQTRQQTSGGNCAWLDEVSWKHLEPSIEGDTGAVISGDSEKGYVITPSEGAKEVKVTIPEGVDRAKVTVKVSPEAKVTPNGATVKVVRGEHDITGFLDIPKAVEGVIDLSAATVKEEYVKEPFNVEKGAKIDLSSTTEPSFTTAPTQKGLTYRLKEGATLEEMRADTDGDYKIGDGEPWVPAISEKGGFSGFYTIEVTK